MKLDNRQTNLKSFNKKKFSIKCPQKTLFQYYTKTLNSPLKSLQKSKDTVQAKLQPEKTTKKTKKSNTFQQPSQSKSPQFHQNFLYTLKVILRLKILNPFSKLNHLQKTLKSAYTQQKNTQKALLPQSETSHSSCQKKKD
jgi:hypothetical protein